MKSNQSTKSNFGKKGWLYIIYTLFALMFMSSLCNESLNLTLPALAETNGWDTAALLNISTYAGWISVAVSFVIAWIMDRKGSRFVFVISFLLGAISFAWMGNAASILSYAVAIVLFSAAANCFGMLCCSNLLAYWFPDQKGPRPWLGHHRQQPVPCDRYPHYVLYDAQNRFG